FLRCGARRAKIARKKRPGYFGPFGFAQGRRNDDARESDNMQGLGFVRIQMEMTRLVRVLAVLTIGTTTVPFFSDACAVKRGNYTEKAQGQGAETKPAVVQPGAPGEPSKTLPASTKGTLPPRSKADAEFMQGMVMHHAQAVEMTALIESHTENKALRSL